MFASIEESVAEVLNGEAQRQVPAVRGRALARRSGGFGRASAWREALKADTAAPDAELRRVVVDVTIEAGLGRFFAAKLRSGALYSLYHRTASAAALAQALREYENAKSDLVTIRAVRARRLRL